MPRLLDYLSPLYSWLAAINPDLPRALFVALVFFSVWLLRKLAPNQWERFANLIGVKSDDTSWLFNELRAAWQMLPAAIIGTVYGVLGTGADAWSTLKLTLLALLAPVVHRIAQRYQGKLGEPKPPASRGGGSSKKDPEPTRVWFDNPRDPDSAAMTSLQRRRRQPRLVMGFAFLLAFMLGSAVGLTSCSPAVQAPSTEQLVEKSTALAFNGAVMTLLWLDEQEARYLDSLPHPTQLQIAESELRVGSLKRARDALAIVRRVLSGELENLDEREKLREAVKALDLVAFELEHRGVQLPTEVHQALAVARVVL